MASFIKKIYYKLWLRHWSHKTTCPGEPNLHVKRRYELSPVYIDLYWVITDKKTGKKSDLYDRINCHDIVNVVKRKDRHVLRYYQKHAKH